MLGISNKKEADFMSGKAHLMKAFTFATNAAGQLQPLFKGMTGLKSVKAVRCGKRKKGWRGRKGSRQKKNPLT